MAGHMSPEEFRRHGRAVVDWIADYMERVETLPVGSRVRPGDVRQALPPTPPEHGEPFEALLADLERVILPGITHWQHPNFHAYFPANASGPAILADLLSSGLGVQGMLWATSPACTEVEEHVLDWLVDLLGLPDRFRSTGPGGGVIQDSASSATLVALLAALHRASGGEVGRTGVTGRYAVYGSTEAHSALDKAVRIAGLGSSALRLVEPRSDTLALDPARLSERLAADRAAGIVPVMVVATVGTTSTGAVDPVREIGALCQEYGAWLHVDAAYAGVAAVCPQFRWLNDGLDLADSYCTNPHKWLLTNFDCDAFWVADRAPLIGALSVLPEFLRTRASESGAVVDYRDWQVPLGRRFRALKLWAVIRWYGATGLRAHIELGVELAHDLAERVRADERFDLVAEPHLSLVCFRLRGTAADVDPVNETLLERLNASGRLYLSHTRVNGAYTLRFAVGAPSTDARHVAEAWERIRRAADELS